MDDNQITTLEAQLGSFQKEWDAKFSKVDAGYAKLEDSIAELSKKATAELHESGPLAGITDFKVWDIPVGQAIVGGGVAVFATELLDGFLSTQPSMMRGVIKLVGAGVVVKWGSGLLGSTGAKAAALLIAFDGIRDLVPIDTWMKGAAGKVSGIVTNKGLAQNSAPMSAVNQARRVAGDYYSRLSGGR